MRRFDEDDRLFSPFVTHKIGFSYLRGLLTAVEGSAKSRQSSELISLRAAAVDRVASCVSCAIALCGIAAGNNVRALLGLRFNSHLNHYWLHSILVLIPNEQ